MQNVLVSWVGQADLNAANEEDGAGLGPLASALEERAFDRGVLLCNYDQGKLDHYMKWLGVRTEGSPQIEAHHVELSSPTDYRDIYKTVSERLKELSAKLGSDFEFTFHLSPGTPAMAVVWIMLASSRYPARLIQTSVKHGTQDVNLPFDISAEFVPDLVRRSRQMEELAGGLPPMVRGFDSIIHCSKVMAEVLDLAHRSALAGVPVLIEGESGTGKELLAQGIHEASNRFKSKFVPVNCGAIPENLVESHLFGHLKGSFSGATDNRIGIFQEANGGTVFLDEIGELPLPAQAKLLRVLQEGKFMRVGATTETAVDVRIIAATNRSLIEEVRSGRFRGDLFYRLAVAVLRLPPLHEREGDLGLLIDQFVKQINAEQSKLATTWEDRRLSTGARAALMAHRWPGNIRELFNTITRAIIWSREPVVSKREITDAILPSIVGTKDSILDRPLGPGLDVTELVDQVRTHYVERALREAGGVKTKAADLIGLANSTTLTNWMKALVIGADD